MFCQIRSPRAAPPAASRRLPARMSARTQRPEVSQPPAIGTIGTPAPLLPSSQHAVPLVLHLSETPFKAGFEQALHFQALPVWKTCGLSVCVERCFYLLRRSGRGLSGLHDTSLCPLLSYNYLKAGLALTHPSQAPGTE